VDGEKKYSQLSLKVDGPLVAQSRDFDLGGDENAEVADETRNCSGCLFMASSL
jgi:hypothetical protein